MVSANKRENNLVRMASGYSVNRKRRFESVASLIVPNSEGIQPISTAVVKGVSGFSFLPMAEPQILS
jgi:hypothetical protein